MLQFLTIAPPPNVTFPSQENDLLTPKNWICTTPSRLHGQVADLGLRLTLHFDM